MKFRAAIFLTLLAVANLLAVIPPTQSVTLAWGPTALDTNFPTVFRIYEIGPVTNVVAMVTNAFQVTLTNVLTIPHKWTCTASNYTGESDMSLPLQVPGAPAVPTNLRPVSTTLHNVPLPGIIQQSRDLVNWNESMRFRASDGSPLTIDVTQVTSPVDPMKFMRGVQAVDPPSFRK